jgi:hypothetical protein
VVVELEVVSVVVLVVEWVEGSVAVQVEVEGLAAELVVVQEGGQAVDSAEGQELVVERAVDLVEALVAEEE